MKSKLKYYSTNAKKWRIENGYTTPEWEMYVDNRIFNTQMLIVVSFALGIIFGVIGTILGVIL